MIDPNDLLDNGSEVAEALGHLLGPMEDDRMIGTAGAFRRRCFRCSVLRAAISVLHRMRMGMPEKLEHTIRHEPLA